MRGTAGEGLAGMTVRSVERGLEKKTTSNVNNANRGFIYPPSLPREVYPFLSVPENLSFKCDNCLKCDLKAATLEEVKENLISVISDTLTQELSKIPQASPSTVKAFASNIETQKPTFDKRDYWNSHY